MATCVISAWFGAEYLFIFLYKHHNFLFAIGNIFHGVYLRSLNSEYVLPQKDIWDTMYEFGQKELVY